MKSLKELQEIREKTLESVNLRTNSEGTRVVVGMATCGIAAGARPVMLTLVEEVKKRNLDIMVTQTGCIGVCRLEPIVEVYPAGSDEKITYVKVSPEMAKIIVAEHLVNGNVVERFTIGAAE